MGVMWDELREWLQALVAPILAGFGIYIAWQQHKISRHRLRHDLFEKRYAVFQAVVELLNEGAYTGDVSLDSIGNFIRKANEGRFLFGPDIVDYLMGMREKAVRCSELNHKLHREKIELGLDRDKAVEEETELQKWFLAQYEESVSRFAPYLRFDESAA